MKAATGELQLTVITLIAIAAVIGFFWIMWPQIRTTIQAQWNNVETADHGTGNSTGQAGLGVTD